MSGNVRAAPQLCSVLHLIIHYLERSKYPAYHSPLKNSFALFFISSASPASLSLSSGEGTPSAISTKLNRLRSLIYSTWVRPYGHVTSRVQNTVHKGLNGSPSSCYGNTNSALCSSDVDNFHLCAAVQEPGKCDLSVVVCRASV